MPATSESTHAEVFVWLPSTSIVTFRWRNNEAEIIICTPVRTLFFAEMNIFFKILSMQAKTQNKKNNNNRNNNNNEQTNKQVILVVILFCNKGL